MLASPARFHSGREDPWAGEAREAPCWPPASPRRRASLAWDWEKIDAGLRVTVLKQVDLSLEYSFHDIGASHPIRHDEALATLRLSF
jgi:hypothetical protein